MLEWFTTQFGFSTLLIVAVLVVMLTAVSYCIYYERKVSAWMQDRYGPNRVGPVGLLQPVADGGKFVLKEDPLPDHVDKPLFVLAPMISFSVALVGFAVIPWGGKIEFANGNTVSVQVANPDIGLLYILAMASLAVYGVVLGAWASNNKYSFYGGMRATAQMLSYEVPMGVVILIAVLISGQLRLEQMVTSQIDHMWNVVYHPLACFLLIITAFAEANRTPFDLPEAEQELVGGYHTEYGALKFGLFFLGEYAHMITSSALIIALFFGGYHLPGVSWCQPEDTGIFAALVKVAVYSAKIALFIFLYMWIRWTLPRFRFDQLMRIAWKGMLPISLGLLTLAMVMLYFNKPHSVAWGLIGNAVILVVVLVVLQGTPTRITGRQQNLPEVSPKAGATG